MKLTTLVQIAPNADILPVRADYEGRGANTIGANHLTCSKPVWFTLADCIASKLLTGRSPKVIQALRFTAMAPQRGLRDIQLNGDPDQLVRPRKDDFYRRVIQLRQQVKRDRDEADGPERDRLEAAQFALKIVANATSYGIFAEVNVQERRRQKGRVSVYTGGEAFETETAVVEDPGRYFHPLVATLITGAARVMLAMTEHLVGDAGLEWSFCDTDSMAIARPPEMDQAAFHTQVGELVARFSSLNPYGSNDPVLQIEAVNGSLDAPERREPLFCYAVSAKRYVLFNVDDEQCPQLRKASAHGLGHLRAPYDQANSAPSIPKPRVKLDKIGVALWQHDLWWLLARAALRGPVVQLPLDHHSALKQPAVGRYAATTPIIQRWFEPYNRKQPYDLQVKPFGFLLAMTGQASDQSPVAPYDRDLSRAVGQAFDRNTGLPVASQDLKTYAQALAQYHLHPEGKFLNGQYRDHGTTLRRNVLATDFTHIGKEANRWEEQAIVGTVNDAEVDYGSAPDAPTGLTAELKWAAQAFGQRRLAAELGVSRNTLSSWLTQGFFKGTSNQTREHRRTLVRLRAERERDDEEQAAWRLKSAEEVLRDGLSQVANRLGMDPSNLRKVLTGRRRCPSDRPISEERFPNQDEQKEDQPGG